MALRLAALPGVDPRPRRLGHPWAGPRAGPAARCARRASSRAAQHLRVDDGPHRARTRRLLDGSAPGAGAAVRLDLLRTIADKHGIATIALVGPSHKPRIVAARRELYRVLRGDGWSYPAIAALVGRDHTSVLRALKPRTLTEAQKIREKARRAAIRAARRTEA